jgi:hypothetical protein
MEINAGKTEIMAFGRKEPVRSTTCISNKVMEQVNTFDYLGCDITYKIENGLNMKSTNFVTAVGIKNHISKPSLVSRHTRIQI